MLEPLLRACIESMLGKTVEGKDRDSTWSRVRACAVYIVNHMGPLVRAWIAEQRITAHTLSFGLSFLGAFLLDTSSLFFSLPRSTC